MESPAPTPLPDTGEDVRIANRLLRATIEATEDGILVVDAAGHVRYTNSRFAEIWGFTGVVGEADDGALLTHIVAQLLDPQAFLDKVIELSSSDAESIDSVQLRDGRMLARYSRPLRDAGPDSGRVWSFRDITERRHIEDALSESEARFRALAQNSSDIIVIVDGKGMPTYASPSVERIMGYGVDELKDVNLVSLLHPDDLASGGAAFGAVLNEPGQYAPREVRLQCKNGEWRNIDLVANNMLDDPAIRGIVFNAHDVTDRVAAEKTLLESEERLRRMAETTPVGIFEISAAGAVTYMNPACLALFEVAEVADINERSYEDFFPPESIQRIAAEVSKTSQGAASTIEVELIGARGTRRDVLITGAELLAESISVGVIGTVVDISERREQERVMEFAATHDPLTEAMNRNKFEEEVAEQIARDIQSQSTSAVLFIDLDDFKAVNDTFGHPVGDRLLMRTARVLHAELKDGDVLARLGGDEFAVLLPGADARMAKSAARKLIRGLGQHPVDIEGRMIDTLCSIGIALIPAHGSTPDELLAHADMAMYEAKAHGRNRVSLYTGRGHRGKADERLKWKHRIREALDTDGLQLFGQPIVNLATREVERYELLLRMNGPNGRLLLPGAFLPIAETYGLIAEIDAWVVQEAFRLVRRHRSARSRLRVAVNLSGRALDDPTLVRLIKRQLAQSRVDPADICFEITESAAILDVEKAQRLIADLTAVGCKFALDDFGVGFSSFSRLKHLQIHELKIDGGFIQNLMTSRVDQHLVRAIVELARGLGMRVVAEFVQDEASVQLLKSYGVDLGQGFYLGRPIPVDQIRVEQAAQHQQAA